MLGCGLVALSLVAFYVRETVLDTDRYVATMAPIAESPAVQQAVADKLNTAITSRVDFDSLMREALPASADPLAPALAVGLQQAIRSRIDAFVASDNFERLWVEANRRAHARVVALLTTGQSGRLLLDGDTVYLDLGAIVDRVRQALQERGLDRLAAAIPPSGRRPGDAAPVRRAGQGPQGHRPDREPDDRVADPCAAVPDRPRLLSRPRRRGLLRVGLGLIVTALILIAAAGIGRSAYLERDRPERAAARRRRPTSSTR